MSVMDVFEAVVKADDAAGAAFIDAVVYDYLADEAQAVVKDLSGLYAIVGLDRIQEAKRQLGRTYVAKMVEGEYPDDSYLQVAEYLAGLEQYVSKALAWANNGRWDKEEHPRDARGRWARKINSSTIVPLDENFNAKQGGGRKAAPMVRQALDNDPKLLTGDGDKGKKDKLGATQSQYEQAIRVAGDFKRAMKGADAKDVEIQMLFTRDSGGGTDIVRRTFTLDQFDGKNLPDDANFGTEMTLVAMEVQAARGANDRTQDIVGAYNLLGESGGATLASFAGVEPKRVQALTASLGMDYQPDESRLTRFFNRLGAGGDVLAQVTGQEKLGQAVAFVGSVGPQAEQALGPYAQRAAYRYRGTETTPNRQLLGQFRNIEAMEKDPEGMKATDGIRGATPVEGFVAANSKRGLEGDSLAMSVRADVASAELARTLPKDPMLARLSELSGQVLPSQGILINADGKVQSQAVGFTDDHYLPFDLKNLGALRGGQYARTRQSGGLTGEDIYAAVTMGARQVQVISPSGVFTLEMAPDFRGARGNSDKARAMYDRYLKILDAVENSDQYLMDISPRDKAKIRDDVRQMGYKDDDFNAEVATRITEARRAQSSVTEDDEKAAQAKVMTDMGLQSEAQITANGATARAYEAAYEEEIDRVRSVKANKLRLNGEGYAMAMTTLQQQFPYFVRRAEYRPLNDFVNEGGPALKDALPKGRQYAEDSGYARPGSLRAKNVQSGFYNRGPLQPGPKPRAGQKAATPAPEAEQAPADADTNPDAPAAPAAPDAPATTAPAARKTALEPRLQARLPQLKEARGAAITSLSSQLGKAGVHNDGLVDQSMAEAAAGGTEVLAEWLLIQDAKSLSSIFADPNKALAAAGALSNRNAVTAAFESIITGGEAQGGDFFDKLGRIGPEPGMDAAVEWVGDQAQLIADTIVMEMPFTVGNDPFHGGNLGNPSIVAQAYDGMERLTNSKQLLDYQQQDENKAVWAEATKLLVSGDRYRTLGEIGLEASGKVAALKMIDTLQSKSNDDIVNSMDRKKVQSALTLIHGIDPNVPDGSIISGDIGDDAIAAIRQVPAKQLAAGIQRAWSLATTTRLIEALDRGDVVPFGEGRLMKSAARIKVLPSSHPLSQAVASRVSKGLPFVPVRTGRRILQP